MRKNYEIALSLIDKYVQEKTQIKHAKNDEVLNIIIKRNERNSRIKPPTVKSFVDNLIIKRLDSLAQALPDDGYSMGGYFTVRCNKFKGSYSNESEYSYGCKWKATHGGYGINITPEDLRHTSNIGGVYTYIYPNQRNKVKKCWWYEGRGAKQHFSIEKVEGYIYGGYHDVSKKRAKDIGSLHLKRKYIKDNRENLIAKASRKQYSYQDSLDAGNCEVGTKAFIMRCHLDMNKKYRGSYLLKLAKKRSTSSVPFINRMIEYGMESTVNNSRKFSV